MLFVITYNNKSMLAIKTKYKNKTMSNGIVGVFNTSDIDTSNSQRFYNSGFKHIFNIICDKCELKKCICE